ncbi:class F sortase [Streptomyces sp. NPDC046203]|uniref:class F sortase n=1 Tax=Streptomyces sp. NPDC046203 TaxID=3154602 RepID=UPI0033CD2A59
MTVSLVVGGVWWAADDQPPSAPVLAAAPVGHGVAAPVAARPVVAPQAKPQPPLAPLKPSRPTALAVPAITIQAPVVGLDLDASGQLAVPPVDNPRVVGWYAKGVTPGERGTAVMVGHRDTRTGPAIFLNLNVLNPGNTVRIARDDGRVAVFTVDKVRTYDKATFPDSEVYGPADRAELRLLTCGGPFDRKHGYASNIVVFAHLTGVDRQI